jgi:hypothetical protein
MACTKETIKSNGLNIWSSNSVSESALEVELVWLTASVCSANFVQHHPCSRTGGRSVLYMGCKEAGLGDFQTDEAQGSGTVLEADTKARSRRECSTEVMWPRDLLVPSFQNARIATYSYKSDWRDRNVKTSLRECAEQFLNVLFQHRQHAIASHLEVHTSIRLYVFSRIAMTGTSEATRPDRTQSWRSCHPAGLFHISRKARCYLLTSEGTRHCCPSTTIC